MRVTLEKLAAKGIGGELLGGELGVAREPDRNCITNPNSGDTKRRFRTLLCDSVPFRERASESEPAIVPAGHVTHHKRAIPASSGGLAHTLLRHLTQSVRLLFQQVLRGDGKQLTW